MDPVHLHLLLNHVPVIGAVFTVLLLAVALLRNSTELGKTSLGILGLLAAVAIVVYLTGEPTEEVVERLPGVSEAAMERHEDVALVATIAMTVLGVLALAALGWFRQRVLPRWISGAALLATLAVTGVMGFTANLGGQIRHSEIRPGGVVRAP
ncbi:MAG TPA: hypothetical protein VGE02_00515 [Gemmatimonadales bacterium]